MSKPVRIKIEIGKPKRRSVVYVRDLHWGIHGATRRKDEGTVVDLKIFQRFQLEEGPNIFNGLSFSIIPCKNG